MNDKQELPHTPAEVGDYANQPKNAPTGADTLNPIIVNTMSTFRRMNHGRLLEEALSKRDNPLVEAVRNGTVKMEQALQVLQPRGFPTDIDSNIFGGREMPIRSVGESETRSVLGMPPLDRSQQPRPISLDRMMKTHGYARDGESNVFDSLTAPNADFDGSALMISSNYLTLLEKISPDFLEGRNADKALIHTATPLDKAEYVNRKLGYLSTNSDEYRSAEAERLQRKEEARLARIQRNMAGGMSLEEAELNDAYNAKAGQELRAEAELHKTTDLFNDLELLTPDQALEQLLAERKPGWEVQVKKLQTQQAELQAALARSEAKDQAKRKQVLLDEGYSETEAEWMKVYSKAQWHNLQVEWHLARVQYHKGQLARLLKAGHKQVDAIRIAARIQERYMTGNPSDYPEAPELNWVDAETPPPAPIVDFSTSDLEMPERFIIKDLDGFKFDPDTQFDGLRLPYDSCLFVLGQEPQRAVVLATQEDEDVITLKLLSEQKSELPWHADATLYVRLNGTRARLKWVNTRRALDKRLGMVSCVLGFLAGEQVNEIDIETVITAPEGRDIPPPKPGFSYNVVHLTQGLKGKRKDWQGGTHASPREHKRKGYWWPGRKGPIWIKATIVNKGVLGRVDKEYHVTKLEG